MHPSELVSSWICILSLQTALWFIGQHAVSSVARYPHFEVCDVLKFILSFFFFHKSAIYSLAPFHDTDIVPCYLLSLNMYYIIRKVLLNTNLIPSYCLLPTNRFPVSISFVPCTYNIFTWSFVGCNLKHCQFFQYFLLGVLDVKLYCSKIVASSFRYVTGQASTQSQRQGQLTVTDKCTNIYNVLQMFLFHQRNHSSPPPPRLCQSVCLSEGWNALQSPRP